jgi:hypothetical protein
MKDVTLAIAGALALAVSASGGQQPPPKPYAPLEFLVGSCWAGTLGDGNTDTHCFEWVLGGKFLRDRHEVSSSPKYEGETTYAWDPATHRVLFRYISNMGLLLDGTVEQQGASIVSTGTYPGDSGAIVTVRATWTRTGEDSYRAVGEERTTGDWKPALAVEYHRVKR